MKRLLIGLALLLGAARPVGAQPTRVDTFPGKVRIASTATDAMCVGGTGVSPAANACTGGIYAGAETVSTGGAAVAGLGARFNSSNPVMGITIANSNGFPYLGFNTIAQASSDTPKYEINGFATQLRMDNGTFTFSTASSGTAGNAITLTSQMVLSNSGSLSLNTAAGNAIVLQPSTTTNAAYVTLSSTGGTSFMGSDDSTGSGFGGGAYGVFLYSAPAAGITLRANNAAGTISFKTGGNNLRWGINAAGDWTFGSSSHIAFSSGTPSINTGFGTASSVTGTDLVMTITLGNTPGSSGTINFGHTFSTVPGCSATPLLVGVGTPAAWVGTTTTSSVVVKYSGLASADQVVVHCPSS